MHLRRARKADAHLEVVLPAGAVDGLDLGIVEMALPRAGAGGARELGRQLVAVLILLAGDCFVQQIRPHLRLLRGCERVQPVGPRRTHTRGVPWDGLRMGNLTETASLGSSFVASVSFVFVVRSRR